MEAAGKTGGESSCLRPSAILHIVEISLHQVLRNDSFLRGRILWHSFVPVIGSNEAEQPYLLTKKIFYASYN